MTVRQAVVDAPAVNAPPPAARFSNGLLLGDRLLLSGMHAGDGTGGVLGDGSPHDQARVTFEKIRALVEAAGGVMDDVVLLRVYLTRIEDKADVGRARAGFFSAPYPCSTLVQVSGLVDPGLVVEVEVEAVVGSSAATTGAAS